MAAKTDRAAELQRERDEDISKLSGRVADVERKYQQQAADKRGPAGAAAGLREEVQEDVKNVRHAVDDLKTTTTGNWWERHEQAMKRTADDVEADVRRVSGVRALPEIPKTPTAPGGDVASSAPFTSQRDRFVTDLRARIESWDKALEKVTASGARKTELDDVRARVRKLDEDLDRLDKANADDWWDVTKARVSDYIDRVEKSVARLDNHPADTTPRSPAPRNETRR